jgi:RNA polymerase sigma-70 factor (ECF subfamily)
MHEDAPEDAFSPRLGSMETRWSLLRRAHSEATGVVDARRVLVLRYAPAIRGYVSAITRDEDQTDELSQEAIVRLMRGDFAGADPNRGRFRDLLKTALRNMARNYWKRQQSRAQGEFDFTQTVDGDASSPDESFEQNYRQTILKLAMERLAEYERQNPDSRAHTLLELRRTHPDATSEQLAELFTGATGQAVQPATLRQKLRRARVRFAELLVRELADGLEQPTADRIEDELLALGLFEYVRDVLPGDWREQLA